MARQILTESEVAQTNALMRPSASSNPMLLLYLSGAAEWVRAGDDLPAPSTDDGNCLIGLSVALGLEAVMAFSLYGIWQVWHLIR